VEAASRNENADAACSSTYTRRVSLYFRLGINRKI